MRRWLPSFMVMIFIIFLVGCIDHKDIPRMQKVGMLIEGSIDDHSWNQRGYEGLLGLSEQYQVDIYYKEHIQTKNQVIQAVDEFVQNGVYLIFGHSNIYGRFFVQIAKEYPQVQFVYFNGSYFDENVTSLNFNAHAMGFFSGMVAAKMTKNNHVGVIAAHEWQPEIEGFYEGVKFQDSQIKVHINYTNSWHNYESALAIYEQMKGNEVDVFYPVSEYFSEEIIRQATKDNSYAIGYVIDQSHIDQNNVLTSTVQHIDKLYIHIAEKYNEGQLKGGYFSFDFHDDLISLSHFSNEVPLSFQKTLVNYINQYRETNLLPHEY